jgi:single-strand DNA-binding protein
MANDINLVVLCGRLTRAAELKYTAGGVAVCKFSIAVNRRRKQGEQYVEEASFFDIVLWGRRGEALQKYLEKGKQIAVHGELRQNRWEHNGQTYSKVEIHTVNLQLLGGGQDKPPKQGFASGESSGDDDIPF